MVAPMVMREEDLGTSLSLAETDGELWSLPTPAPALEPRDWRSLCEQAQARAETERARADAADARCEALRRSEIEARWRAGSLKTQLDRSREKLAAALGEVAEVRRAAKDALLLQSEVARLEKLLLKAGVDSRKGSTIMSLRQEIARQREANAAQGKKIKALRAHRAKLQARIARLRSSRAVLSKAVFGSRSEKQETPRSKRKRGQQRGAVGHGRTPRPTLEEEEQRQEPPQDARVCGCCGKPYVANGERCSSLIEISVKAHVRRIVRPRYRRGCDCVASPLQAIAPAPARLFPRTPYGSSVWARILYERFACHRPLRRTAAWMADQGLPIAPGTVADSVPRFAVLFAPLAEAILAHQNESAVRHADETGWRIQSLSEAGRSRRAWLWISVSADAVCFVADPSRSAQAGLRLFGSVKGVVFVVCDRYSAYIKMARELDGKVILCWCWVHQRRDFIECAAGQKDLTQWCEGWVERFASVCRLNKARLKHYDPALERQTPTFDAAQGVLKKAVDGLFAQAEAELADLPGKARQAKALRSLLKHREGLSVFLEHPQVPMDNNLAEREFRGAVIGRRLSFGSDSRHGADFTATMYSVVRTLALNGIDVLRWLEAWLGACAQNGANPPGDLSPWLPWSMSEERKHRFAAPG